MRVLVAGGAGFIGIHLVKALAAGGHEVVVWDDFSTGWAAIEIERFAGVAVDVRRVDIQQPVVPDFGRLDAIFNLACPASPIHYQNDRVRTLMTCVLGTQRLLELAEHEHARFVQASTSEVYGDPEVHPQPESYAGRVNPCGPRACYDEGKRAAESLCFDYARDRGVDVRVARIFNTYGPMMHRNDGRLVSQFVTQALAGAPITVFGTGAQTRSLCYVDDLVEGLLRLAEADRPGGPVNLGNPEEYSVFEVARLVLEATGSRSRVVFQPLPADDPRRRRPDITRAKELLGWQPEVPFAEGLRRTVAYFEKALAT